jgi:predicted Rossmann fold flavoprotein
MERVDLLVIGGGAAGFFGAITAAEARLGSKVLIVERSSQPLTKVRISGGGRCNVTHACFETRPLSTRYPRGARALLSAFSRFQPSDTVNWFQERGVELKTEADGRMFPVTDDSETIVHCLMEESRWAGVGLKLRCGVDALERLPDGEWWAALSDGSEIKAGKVLVATGGCRSGNIPALLQKLGHEIERPVPSLFTFNVDEKWVHDLSGLAVGDAEVSVPGTGLKERGPVLFTHWGFSGPAILRLSAWGARELEERHYAFDVRIQWVPGRSAESLLEDFQKARQNSPGRLVTNSPQGGLPSRLWEALVVRAGISPTERWNQLPRAQALVLANAMVRTELPVNGKSLHKDEFVTCGGVDLKEVDFRTMESRVCPGLYFAGEVLDVDGITGGFNFQAAWTTGWLAGQAIFRS